MDIQLWYIGYLSGADWCQGTPQLCFWAYVVLGIKWIIHLQGECLHSCSYFSVPCSDFLFTILSYLGGVHTW